jgi:hypothetical protein
VVKSTILKKRKHTRKNRTERRKKRKKKETRLIEDAEKIKKVEGEQKKGKGKNKQEIRKEEKV